MGHRARADQRASGAFLAKPRAAKAEALKVRAPSNLVRVAEAHGSVGRLALQQRKVHAEDAPKVNPFPRRAEQPTLHLRREEGQSEAVARSRTVPRNT